MMSFGKLETFRVYKLNAIAEKETDIGEGIELILQHPNETNWVRSYVPTAQKCEFTAEAITFFEAQIKQKCNPYIVPLKMKMGRRLLILPYGKY